MATGPGKERAWRGAGSPTPWIPPRRLRSGNVLTRGALIGPHYTCGPAACTAALSYCGVLIRERDLAALCLTRQQGTCLFDLYRGVVLGLGDRSYRVSKGGLDVDALLACDHLVEASNAGLGHALCIAVRSGSIEVHDPLHPELQPWSREELAKQYHAPAIVIRSAAVTPSPR